MAGGAATADALPWADGQVVVVWAVTAATRVVTCCGCVWGWRRGRR